MCILCFQPYDVSKHFRERHYTSHKRCVRCGKLLALHTPQNSASVPPSQRATEQADSVMTYFAWSQAREKVNYLGPNFFLFFLKWGLTLWNALCSPGWLQIQGKSPASVSQVLGLLA